LAAPLPATDEPSRLGVAYVVGGASVGARQLARQAEALGFGPGRAASFLHGFAQGSMWNGVLASLDAARLDPHQTDRCRAAAVATFATAEAAFGGLEELR
jgi:heme oxygenase